MVRSSCRMLRLFAGVFLLAASAAHSQNIQTIAGGGTFIDAPALTVPAVAGSSNVYKLDAATDSMSIVFGRSKP